MLEINPVAGLRVKTTPSIRIIGEQAVTIHQPTPEGISQIIKYLKSRSAAFRKIPACELIEIFDEVQKLWQKGKYRQQYLTIMRDLVGHSEGLLELELDISTSFLSALISREFMKKELGSVESVDQWVDNGYVRIRRHPLGFIFHNLAGNASAVPTASIFSGMITKNVNLVKSPGDDPYFPALFAESLKQVDKRVLDGLAVVHWPGSAAEYYDSVFSERPDGIVHWGGKETLSAISAHAGKYGIKLIQHGPKISFVVVDVYEKDLGEKIAHDAVIWEQKACLSPRVVFAQSNFAERLAEDIFAGFEKVATLFPKIVTPDLSSQILAKRQSYMLDVEVEGNGKVLYNKNSHSTVVYKKTPVTEADIDSCMDRFVIVNAVQSLNDVLDFLANPGLKAYLQTLGYNGNDDCFKEQATLLGFSHITKIGQMNVHMPGYSHDGISNLVELTTLASDQKNCSGLAILGHR